MTSGYIVLGRPDWAQPRLAPDGDRLAAIRWHDGSANIWTGSGRAPMQLVTDLRRWRLRDFHWGADGSGLVLALDDAGGRRRWLAWLELRSGAITRLTPELSADARYAGQVAGDKPRILMSVRLPRAKGAVLQSVTTTGEVISEWEGPDEPVSWWLANEVAAVAVCSGASTCRWWQSQLADEAWTVMADIPAVDAQVSRPVTMRRADLSLFATSSADRDTIALVRMSGPERAPEVIYATDNYDVTSVLTSADTGAPEIVTTTNPDSPQVSLTDGAAADLSRLRHLAGDAPARIIDRNAGHCLAEISNPVGGPAFVTFSRTSRAVSKPLARYTSLSRIRMHGRMPFKYRARDGRPISGFLTRPPGAPPWPTVLVVHDGPWTRDEPHMDPWAQYLASAGFCCVQLNYRGSRGFGKDFRVAGDRQWSLAMQDDLVDGLRAPEVAEVADPIRIAAMGHGYGGYAALMLATQDEVRLACGISASAPTELDRYVSGLLSFGGGAGYAYASRIGDPEAGRDQLVRASPVTHAKSMTIPLLLFHGRQDACVPVSHLTAFADALRRAGKPPEVVIYEDEGHVYSRPQNVADFRLRTLEFLHTKLIATAGPDC